ncbi:rab proteins geranylgeranyltransferase component A [[Candida] jaroonii]|uniref:Rab proteins geranylgeranyltransferase component A n=1 Tax=[Candida] jaroonii TaxID=467808 RepID=A0ACA9Y3A3_9ASCO|nr:rab proteins geranylgeranyltransferase component A [[Candida] jaroonii]
MSSFHRAERRKSVAERSPSVSYAPDTIPQLAGLEKPQEHNLHIGECDVLVMGTGLVESVVAAALSWQGVDVLHIDNKTCYGDSNSTLTIEQVKSWCQEVNSGRIQHFEDAQVYVTGDIYHPQSKFKSKDYGIDLTPKIMFAQSDLLSLLVKSRVYKYLEFQSLSNFHIFENDSFSTKFANASSKEEIFTDQSLSLLTKRYLMKFLKFVLEDNNDEDKRKTLADNAKVTIYDFLSQKFNLETSQINELIYSIGLCIKPTTKTPEAIARIRRFLVSFNVYGNFPVLVSKYGGPGEISQGFCRSAAVAGTTYKLNTALTDYDPQLKLAKFSDKSSIKINEKLIVAPTQIPKFLQSSYNEITESLKKVNISRLVVIVKKDCKEWMADQECSAMVVFPPESLNSQNKTSIQALIQNGGTGVCPPGQSIWYLTSFEQDSIKAKQDLQCAFEKMESSILRESSDLDDVLDENLSVNKSGTSLVVNSVKLGKSLQNFVPKETLEIICKFGFTQKTYVLNDLSNVINPTDENNVSLRKTKDCEDIIFTNMPSSEISYDGIVKECKTIYQAITGSDDDFFDVDFEDDDEFNPAGFHQQPTTSSSNLKTSDNDMAIASSDDEDNAHPFGADEMEL